MEQPIFFHQKTDIQAITKKREKSLKLTGDAKNEMLGPSGPPLCTWVLTIFCQKSLTFCVLQTIRFC